MTTRAPWTKQWQPVTADIREQFWGDLTRYTRQSWQDFLGRLSLEARDRYRGCASRNAGWPGPMPATAFTSATL
jgi:hypothetical protein